MHAALLGGGHSQGVQPASSSRVFDVPGLAEISDATLLYAVDRYTHLGGVIDVSGSLVPDASHRCSSAMTA